MAWSKATLIPLFLLAPLANAFSFTFVDKATQCEETRITIDDEGQPPFRLVLVPAGSLPEGQMEIRTILDVTFSEREYTLPPLAFPGGSNFIALMSDSTGVGTGGTSVITDVANSDDNSCLATQATVPAFFIFTDPQGPFTQCSNVNISWDDRTQGRVVLYGLIPGGESFEIPVPDGATSVQWTPRVRAGTNMLIVAGDDRGRGTGGSTPAQAIQGGSESCFSGEEVYSSTNAPYAGGQYMTGSGGGTVTGGGNTPTGSSTATPNESTPDESTGSSSKKSNTGMIVGIVVGVVVALLVALLLLFLWWRKRSQRNKRQRTGVKQVDLLRNGSEAAPNMATGPGLQPTPFVPPPAPASSSGDRSSTDGRGRESVSTWRSGAPLVSRTLSPTTENSEWLDTEATSEYPGSPRASHPPSSWQFGGGAAAASGDRPKTAESTRPPGRISYVQHQDAGAIPDVSPPPTSEVIDLPPSYNDIGQGRGGAHVSPV